MIGQTISHYRILSRLGSGGMGVVYEAQDLTLARRVALRFLPAEIATESAALDRFLLEALAASALNHPNVCTIYAVEKDDGQSFIAMELLEGQSLHAKLQTGPVPLNLLLEVAVQLADAPDAACPHTSRPTAYIERSLSWGTDSVAATEVEFHSCSRSTVRAAFRRAFSDKSLSKSASISAICG